MWKRQVRIINFGELIKSALQLNKIFPGHADHLINYDIIHLKKAPERKKLLKNILSIKDPFLFFTPHEKEIGENSKNQAEKDELYHTALEIIKSEGKASTSFLQRKLQIGYNRAARIIDMMEANGIVSKANHVGKREVL